MTYALHLAVMLGLYGMLALAANFSIGLGGLLSLSTAAFYGLGAYLYGILAVRAGMPFAAALPAAVAGVAVFGGLFACVTLRFRGETFTVATMAVQMILFGVFYNWTDVTGGPFGFPDIPRPAFLGVDFESPAAFCALTLTCAVGMAALMLFLKRTRFALALRSIRDDEPAASTLGIAPWRTFAWALVLSAALAAVPGALFAAYVSYVDPAGFTIGESVLVLAMLVVGGSGNVRGPLVGAALLVLLPEALRFAGMPSDVAGPLREIVFGLLLIVLMYFEPKGIAGDFAIR